MTMIRRRCKKCKQTIYRYKKEEGASDVWKGAMVGLHLLECDPEEFDRILIEHW